MSHTKQNKTKQNKTNKNRYFTFENNKLTKALISFSLETVRFKGNWTQQLLNSNTVTYWLGDVRVSGGAFGDFDNTQSFIEASTNCTVHTKCLYQHNSCINGNYHLEVQLSLFFFCLFLTVIYCINYHLFLIFGIL